MLINSIFILFNVPATIKLNEQLDSSVYTVEQGRVKQARHMHPVQAEASTGEREDCVVRGSLIP